jgi:malate synthase
MVTIGRLRADRVLVDLVEELSKPARVSSETFWAGLAEIVETLGPRNRALLEKRDALQRRIDEWHRQRRGQRWNGEEYETFLRRGAALHDYD